MKVLMCEYLKGDSVYQVGSHYYAKQFDRNGYKVIWLNKPESYFENITRKSSPPLQNTKYSNNFIEYTPNVIAPFCKIPLLNSKFWAKEYLNVALRDIKEKIGGDSVDIMWMTNVKMHCLLKSIKSKLVIHRMADNLSGYSDIYNNILYLEKEVIKKSDIVIVSARNLVEQTQKLNKNVIYIPNGVDFTRFENINPEMPKEYKNITTPKIVYIGAVDNWFDYELVLESASKMKEYSFIIIGPVNGKMQKILSGVDNIYLLGRKPHNKIPQYLMHSDIGIIPFIDNKLTKSIHPLKLYEYCSAGIPVIARRLEEIENMNSPARLYDNHEEFLEIVKNTINSRRDSKSIIEYAKRNSWEKRFQELNCHIQSALKNC